MQQGGFMRVRALVMMFALFSGAPAFAQTAVPELHPYGLDPYKPSDAALLRTYGGTLLAQTPLLELRQLDPYKPSHANLLRQLGNGIPQWSHFSWYPGAPVPAPLMKPATPPAMTASGSPAGATPGNVVVVLVPPNGQLGTPRLSPERPLPPLPVPVPPQQRAPGSVPGGPVRASIYMTNRVPSMVADSGDHPALNAPVQTPDEAVKILRGSAYNAGQLEAAANDAVRTTEP
jgi:hypothetical protein